QGSSRAALSAGEGGDESQDGEIRLVAPADAFRFRAWSRPGPSPAPEGTARNRDLPAGMDPRVAQLARRVANGAREPQATAEILATFLRKEYRYSLELADAPPDPVAHFLFESRTGHCEHFATALALMLRTLGLEARVATGFYGGSRTSDGRYVLRAGDAHAWTQVRVPGRGFITVDATPEAHRSASASRWSDWWAVQYERLTELWRQSVLDYSFRDQVRVASGLAHAPRLKSQVRVPRAELETVGTLGALLLATLGLFTLYRRRRRRADLHPATLAWLRVERSLGRQGFKRSATEPPREWVSRVSGAQPSLAHPLRSALRRYEETRFGGRTLQPHEAISWLRALRGR
ncbi:MAG TPA: transglutaminase domain-containing protein, partial [Myxococcaceae bacterium]|nr:transglutaminase domain-containing protein [Myxococcaceae bacterium]